MAAKNNNEDTHSGLSIEDCRFSDAPLLDNSFARWVTAKTKAPPKIVIGRGSNVFGRDKGSFRPLS
jgi:hypothetical protein